MYIKSAHLDRLRSVVGDSLALETAVLSLLAKYTKGAKRVVQSLDALDATTDLTPTCKNRVLVHLDNRLVSQEERSSVALHELHNMIDPNGSTALALQHLDNIVKSATEQADELDQCIAGCAADVSMEFGSVSTSGSSGGAVAVTASKVNCEVEIIKLKRQMEQSTERTRRAITSTAGTLANGNHDIGEKLMGADAEKAREEESKRNEELNQYTIAKDQHHELSHQLEILLKKRSDILQGSKLKRIASGIAINELRTKCDEEMKRRKFLVNRSNHTSRVFLSSLQQQLDALAHVTEQEIHQNDEEENHAMLLSSKVDVAAEECVRSMEEITSRVLKRKRDQERPKEEDGEAIASLLRGTKTKEDGADAKDVDEQALKWVGSVVATARDREIDGGPKPSEMPMMMLLERSEKEGLEEGKQDNDQAEIQELKKQALLIGQKFQKAERSGKVGVELPKDLVGNAEATSETFWNDLSNLGDTDVAGTTPEEKEEVGQLVTEVSNMDDDLVTPDNEKKVPLEYSKIAEEIGELKGAGEI